MLMEMDAPYNARLLPCVLSLQRLLLSLPMSLRLICLALMVLPLLCLTLLFSGCARTLAVLSAVVA